MLVLTLYKRVEHSGKIRMIKGGKHLILNFMRFGWRTNKIWIFVLGEESSSSPSRRLGTPES